MRTKLDTSETKFRVAALPRPRQESRSNPAQRRMPDGRPVWTVRLTAIDTGSNTCETIWVEVAGDEPRLTLDELAQVHGLMYVPYVNKDTHKIVRAFRADAITALGEARRSAAA